MHAFISQLNNKGLASSLLLNALLLILLIPGGPIETRDFSQLNSIILVAFNAFLTALGMTSLLFIPLAVKNYQVTAEVCRILALSYFAVYLLDLLSLFPRTPSPMPWMLMAVEWCGIGAAIWLMLESQKFKKRIAQVLPTQQAQPFKKLSPVCILILVVIGNAVVVYATYSAIHSNP